MTAAEAKRLLHPDTTIEAIAEIEYYGGLNGKNAKIAAVDEACIVACAALDKRIPKKPINFAIKDNGYTIYDHTIYDCECPTCGQSHRELFPFSFCIHCGQKIDWGDTE